jgi:hypothetical protein
MIKLTVEKFKTERVVDGDNREGILRVDGQFNHENGRWKTTRNRSSQTASRNSDRDRAMQMQLDEMETELKDFLMDKSDKWQMENSGEGEPELQFPDADGGTDDEDYQETGSDDMNADQGNAWSNPLGEDELTGSRSPIIEGGPASKKKTRS